MRIGVSAHLLHTAGGFQKAGICRYIIRMIDNFATQEGREFVIFHPVGVELHPDWVAAKNLKFVSVNFGNRVRRVLWEHFAPKHMVKEHGLDLWYSTAHCTPFDCGVPRVTVVHDLIPILFPEFYSWEMAAYQKWTLKRTCSVAEHIVTISQATANDMVKAYGTPIDRISIAPLGPGNLTQRVTADSVDANTMARLGVRYDRYLLTLSTVEPRKNLVKLVEAMAHLRKEPGFEDVGLVVAGAKGWKDSHIGETVDRLGLHENVSFLGYIEDNDLPALFAKAEAFVFATLYEGFGIPLLEAMLLGAPAISSDRGALVEVGGDCAAYFDPDSAASMAARIAEVLGSGKREQMVACGLERAKSFTWERTGELTAAVFDRILGKSSETSGAPTVSKGV